MKKITYLFVLVMAMFFVTSAQAQTPWKIINMEEATRWGGNASFDDETSTVSFTGSSDRWIDVPGLNGDISRHTQMELNILKSDCVMRVNLRYKDADGKMQQVACQTFYGQMGKVIKAKKTIKCDLTNGGKIPEEAFKNVVSVRISMAKNAASSEEPWSIQFGKVYLY